MNNEETRFLAIGMLALTATIIAVTSFIGLGIVLVISGQTPALAAVLVMIGYVLLAICMATMAVAMAGRGYCRAFWQTFGMEFSPDTDGETA